MDRKAASIIRRSSQEWARLVDKFRQSGLTQVEFCRRKDLRLSSLQRWCQRFPAAREAFIELAPPAIEAKTGSETGTSWLVELELPNGGVLRLRG